MELSVIIVSHNVRAYLEHCLRSVEAASLRLRVEVIVIDNASVDGTADWLPEAFKGVRFLPQSSNLGFATACNLGLRYASGSHVLFLNPDTLVPEDCFEKCLAFFGAHPEAGALGVRMIDGQGNFLRESKRAFPSPMASLWKMLGLADRFPRQRPFAKYYLGWRDDFTTTEAPILAGAFLMVRSSVVKETGGFDERFFLYGEDIDLSVRIERAGWKNYFFADTTIIHFKGQSSGASGRAYRKYFYGAMRLFVGKYYAGALRAPFRWTLDLGVFVSRAAARMKGPRPRPKSPGRLIIVGSGDDVQAFRKEHEIRQFICEDPPAWVLFCLGDMSAKEAIAWMERKGGNTPCFFHRRGGETIIGPDAQWEPLR